jgi:hypothetical protein
MTRNEAWGWFEGILTNAIAVEKGELACIDTATGLLTIGATSLTLRPIGTFEVDGVVTGDGSATVRVKLFDEIRVHYFDNDTGGTPVVATDLGNLCYVLDGRTVTGDATGASAAGRVWGVNTRYGVAVEMIGFDAAES